MVRGDTRGRAIPANAKVWEARDLDGETGDTGTDAKSDLWMRRQYLINEIAALSKPSEPARRRLRRMWSRMEGLIGMLSLMDESWEARSVYRYVLGSDYAEHQFRRGRLEEHVIPAWQQRFFDWCAETKDVRHAYKRSAAKIAALWDEFWSLSEVSSQAAYAEAFGTDRSVEGLWGDYDTEGRFVRDSEGDWD